MCSPHFYYGPNRPRYQRIDNINQSSEQVTHYVGGIECIWRSNGTVETKRYIGGEVLVTHTGATAQTHYLLTDHLGSVERIINSAGAIAQRMSFDAFGMRRSSTTSLTISARWTFNVALTTRGFTGHEGMDSVGLIHMNGRVYDLRLGRFISADPFVQAPHNTQSLNRYSYVVNNPVSLTDPSGYYYGVENLLYATVINSVIRTIVDNIRYHIVQNNGTFNPAMIVPTGSVPGAFGNGTFGFPNNGDFCSQTTVMCIQPSTLPGAGREVRRTVGETISEGTGGKFANGAAYGAFSMALEGMARSAEAESIGVSASEEESLPEYEELPTRDVVGSPEIDVFVVEQLENFPNRGGETVIAIDLTTDGLVGLRRNRGSESEGFCSRSAQTKACGHTHTKLGSKGPFERRAVRHANRAREFPGDLDNQVLLDGKFTKGVPNYIRTPTKRIIVLEYTVESGYRIRTVRD